MQIWRCQEFGRYSVEFGRDHTMNFDVVGGGILLTAIDLYNINATIKGGGYSNSSGGEYWSIVSHFQVSYCVVGVRGVRFRRSQIAVSTRILLLSLFPHLSEDKIW